MPLLQIVLQVQVNQITVLKQTEHCVALHLRDHLSKVPTVPQPLVPVKPAVRVIPPILVVLKVVFFKNYNVLLSRLDIGKMVK